MELFKKPGTGTGRVLTSTRRDEVYLCQDALLNWWRITSPISSNSHSFQDQWGSYHYNKGTNDHVTTVYLTGQIDLQRSFWSPTTKCLTELLATCGWLPEKYPLDKKLQVVNEDEGWWSRGPAMVLLNQVMTLKLPDLICVLLHLLECVAETERERKDELCHMLLVAYSSCSKYSGRRSGIYCPSILLGACKFHSYGNGR